MAYKMVSELGNAIYYAKTEREKQRLERLGYKEEIKKTTANTSAKRGKKNDKAEN